MKQKTAVVLAFATGLALGTLFSPLRYQLVYGGQTLVFRLDRLTGRVDYSAATNPWEKIK